MHSVIASDVAANISVKTGAFKSTYTATIIANINPRRLLASQENQRNEPEQSKRG